MNTNPTALSLAAIIVAAGKLANTETSTHDAMDAYSTIIDACDEIGRKNGNPINELLDLARLIIGDTEEYAPEDGEPV